MNQFIEIFRTLTNPKEVKRLYFQLALKHHPDKGGDAEVFKLLNNTYLLRLKELDGMYYTGKTTDELKFKFNEEEEQIIIAKINEFFQVAPEHITLDLVGTWLWADNTVKADAELMKSLKFRWSRDKEMWYFTANFKKVHYQNKNGFDTIAFKYGCTRLKSKKNFYLGNDEQ